MSQFDEKELRRKQILFYDQIGDTQFEIMRPHGLAKVYRYMIEYKLNRMRSIMDVNLKGISILNICCGSGMEAEYLTKNEGASVIGIDISEKTLLGIRQRCGLFQFRMHLVRGDCLRLPFKDNSVDYAFAYEGLHHLFDPELGIEEMTRVARYGIFFLEPADAFLTKIARLIGFALSTEPSGNLVHRFNKKKIKEYLNNLGLKKLRFKRFLLEFPHKPLSIYVIFENNIMFFFFRSLLEITNATIGKFVGNKIVVAAMKKDNVENKE